MIKDEIRNVLRREQGGIKTPEIRKKLNYKYGNKRIGKNCANMNDVRGKKIPHQEGDTLWKLVER